MSYDDNNIKSRKSQIYFDSIYREIKRKETKKANSRNNKIKLKISFQRKKNKQLTIGPFSSTLESTISSKRQNSKRQNEEENFNLSPEKITIKSKKLLQPKDQDMKFLFDILYKNNQDNREQTPRQAIINSYINRNKSNEASDQSKPYKFYDLNAIKRYLIKAQKKYNVIGNVMISHKDHYNNKSSENIMDSYQMQKLEDLIARYSLIIFIYLRCGRINEAKEIFLVMLKENIQNIIKVENLLISIYKTINRRINIHNDVPKLTYQLAKIYSFIIKYSQLFNLSNYRNIFMDKYFQIQHLNYNFFMLKGTTRGFSSETRNQIRYWFSYCLHNAMFYTIYYRFPLKIPIICNYNINCLYANIEDTSLTDSEKSLIIKTSYNQGILLYVNNQKEEALLCLKNGKEKINSYSEDYGNNGIKSKKSTINYVKKPKKEEIYEIKNNYREKNKKLKKNKSIILDKDTFRLTKKSSINDLSLRGFEVKKNASKDMSISTKNQYDVLKTKIYKDFKKEQININDIELLVKFGKERGLLNEEPVTGFKGLDFLFKYKESYNCIKKKLTLSKGFRGSHIDFHTSIQIKDFFIPEKFKNPILRKIELLMGIIELDKKNFEAAYKHIINTLYIVFLLKLSGNTSYHKDFYDKQKIELNEYFQLIEDLYEKELKYKQQLEKSSSRSLLTLNDRKSLMNTSVMSSLNMNNSLYNRSNIIFENKAAENHFYKNYFNSKENNNELQSDNNLNENEKKLIKEFEKFFIFLNHLSVYQIKILNETQPDNEKRNHLPLMFSDQFKDSLNRFQRIELDNVQTMALSRFMVLKDPDKWIVPTNLNYFLIGKCRSVPKGKSHNYRSSLDRYDYFDESFMKTKEYKNYLKIINSEKVTPEINDFLKKNRKYVIKIIKQSSDLELNNIIKYPYIIIEPIKHYKRKMKKEISFSRNQKENWGKRPQSMTHSCFSKMMIKGRNSNNRYNFHETNSNDFSKNKGKRNKSEAANSLFNKKKDVTHNNRNGRNYMKNMEKKSLTTDNNNHNGINEESFEDYLLSPEFSSLSKE